MNILVQVVEKNHCVLLGYDLFHHLFLSVIKVEGVNGVLTPKNDHTPPPHTTSPHNPAIRKKYENGIMLLYNSM